MNIYVILPLIHQERLAGYLLCGGHYASYGVRIIAVDTFHSVSALMKLTF